MARGEGQDWRAKHRELARLDREIAESLGWRWWRRARPLPSQLPPLRWGRSWGDAILESPDFAEHPLVLADVYVQGERPEEEEARQHGFGGHYLRNPAELVREALVRDWGVVITPCVRDQSARDLGQIRVRLLDRKSDFPFVHVEGSSVTPLGCLWGEALLPAFHAALQRFRPVAQEWLDSPYLLDFPLMLTSGGIPFYEYPRYVHRAELEVGEAIGWRWWRRVRPFPAARPEWPEFILRSPQFSQQDPVRLGHYVPAARPNTDEERLRGLQRFHLCCRPEWLVVAVLKRGWQISIQRDPQLWCREGRYIISLTALSDQAAPASRVTTGYGQLLWGEALVLAFHSAVVGCLG
jgi:hypothetical protein